jgi:hypothetical protein
MSTNVGDSVAFIEAVALAGCWIWVQSRKLSYSEWKRKAALASFACVSVTAILYLLLRGVMHWIEEGNFRGNLYLGIFGGRHPIRFAVTSAWNFGTRQPQNYGLGLVFHYAVSGRTNNRGRHRGGRIGSTGQWPCRYCPRYRTILFWINSTFVESRCDAVG